MAKLNLDDIIESLCAAVNGRQASDIDPWDYGWCVDEYRRSLHAAANGPNRTSVSFSADAVKAYEKAVERLLLQPVVSRAWDKKEFWGVIVSIIATLPFSLSDAERRQEIKSRLQRITSADGSFVAFEVANVAWNGPAVTIGCGVIGTHGIRWTELAVQVAKGHAVPNLDDWKSASGGPGAPVLYGTWVASQGERARQEAEQRFDDTIALVLLLEQDLNGKQLFSLRGDSHRPGIRGLVIDRQALKGIKGVTADIVADVVVSGPVGIRRSHHFWGNDPFPLQLLIEDPGRIARIDAILSGDSNVHRRLRTAAAWHAKAHWSRLEEDAILALGIAFDSLLGERSGIPGRALADRFALLESEVRKRYERSKRFGELYAARSAIAHGGRTSATEEENFTRSMAADVRDTASRIIAITTKENVQSDDAYREMFEGLKWGSVKP